MKKYPLLLACIVFGALILTTSSHAASLELNSIYCKFDLKDWRHFFTSGSDCEVKLETPWGEFDYDQPLVPTW